MPPTRPARSRRLAASRWIRRRRWGGTSSSSASRTSAVAEPVAGARRLDDQRARARRRGGRTPRPPAGRRGRRTRRCRTTSRRRPRAAGPRGSPARCRRSCWRRAPAPNAARWPPAGPARCTANGRPRPSAAIWLDQLGRRLARRGGATSAATSSSSSGPSSSSVAPWRSIRLWRVSASVAVTGAGRWVSTMHTRWSRRRAGDVVEEAQAGVVGVVDVVDGEQQTVGGRRQADQLGGGHERAAGASCRRSTSISAPARARSISSRWWSGRPSSSVGWRRHTSASASTTGAYGHAPSTGADVPWPTRKLQLLRPAGRSRRAATTCPRPAGPPTISVRLRPAAASSSACSAIASSAVAADQRVVASVATTSCSASSRSRSASASRPGATPSSRRSVRSMRSNWRRAAWRSPLAAWRRMSARWASSSLGVELDHRLPPTVEAQQVEVAQAELLAPLLGPGLVAVLRAAARRRRARAPRGRRRRPRRRAPGGRDPRSARRRRSASASGQQHHAVAAQHDRVRHGDGPPGEVRRLVQLRRRLVDRVVGPDAGR